MLHALTSSVALSLALSSPAPGQQLLSLTRAQAPAATDSDSVSAEPVVPEQPAPAQQPAETMAPASTDAPAAEVTPPQPQPVDANPTSEAAIAPEPLPAAPDCSVCERERPSPAPRWDKPPPLKTGEGLIVAGAGFLTIGIPTTAAGIGLGTIDAFLLAMVMLPGLAVTGGGAGMMIAGVKRRRNYRQWMVDYRVNPPNTGTGFITGGSLVLGATLIPLGVSFAGGGAPFIVPSVLGAITGGVMLGVGVHRRKRYLAWRPPSIARDFTQNLTVAPMTLQRGGGLMLATRF